MLQDWAEVKGFEHYGINKKGTVENTVTGHIIQPYIGNKGYWTIKLRHEETGVVKTTCVHRLLAVAFIENPDNFPQVDHIDRNKLNNDLSNLRWVTNGENSRNRDKFKQYNGTDVTSSFKGVYYQKNSKLKWRASFHLNEKHIIIGSFKTEVEAAHAYNEEMTKRFTHFIRNVV
jgi:hypothetical protein